MGDDSMRTVRLCDANIAVTVRSNESLHFVSGHSCIFAQTCLLMMRECTWQAGAADFTIGMAYDLLPLLTSSVCHSRPPGFTGYSPSQLLGPAFPVVVPRCLACLVVLTRSAMMRFPFLIYMSFPPPKPSALSAVNSDDEVPAPPFLTPHCSGFV
jgi:hypothetical protein